MQRLTIPLAGLMTGIILNAPNASAAIIAGTDNQDGSWTVAGMTIDLQTVTVPFGFGMEDRVTFNGNVQIAIGSVSPPFIGFRRHSNLSVNDSVSQDFLSIYNSFVGGFGAGAQTGSDNYMLLSLESGEFDWDTVVQFNFDSGVGLSGDSIIGVWHDDSASGENILASISNFSELEDLVVPEPSTILLLCCSMSLGFLSRRRR